LAAGEIKESNVDRRVDVGKKTTMAAFPPPSLLAGFVDLQLAF
jgi:hypothetical protein